LTLLTAILAFGVISVAVAAKITTRPHAAKIAASITLTPVPSCPTGSASGSDTWTGGATGSWETGSWSAGEPTRSSYVCIPGGDTVTLNTNTTVAGMLLESGATLEVQSNGLTLSGTSAPADSALQGSLQVASGAGVTVGASATLLNTAGGAIINQGTIAVAGDFEQDAGTVATGSGDKPVQLNDGSSMVFAGSGGGAFQVTDGSASTIGVALSGNIAADQSLEIQGPQSNGNRLTTVTAAGSFTNAGTITLDHASGGESSTELAVPAGDTLTNLSTGTIQTIGSADASYPTQWNENFEGDLDNRGTLDVGMSGDPYSVLVLTAGSTLTNDGGTINLLSTAASSNNTSGTSTLVVSAATTGDTPEPAAVLQNESGTISNQGAITVSGTFTQGAATVPTAAGDNPIQLLSGSSMDFAGSGPGAFLISDPSATIMNESLSGNIAAGQSLEIQAAQGSFGNHLGTVTAAGSFTNAGTITLDHGGSGGEGSVELALPSGDTLTNTGAIKVEGSPDGSYPTQWNENFDGNLDNYGVLDVGVSGQPYANLVLAAGSKLTNEGGTINTLSKVASSDSTTGNGTSTLIVSAATTGGGAEPAAAIVNDTGTINNHGAIVDYGTFTQDAGTVATGAGDNSIDLGNGSSLAFTGTGAGAFQFSDSAGTVMAEALSGNIAAGQSVEIQASQVGYSMNDADVVTAAGSFTNAGTLTLDYSSTGGNEDSAQLALPSGDTLTNTGTISDTGSSIGSYKGEWDQVIDGNVDNKGTLDVGTTGEPTYLEFPSGAALTNEGSVDVGGSATIGADGGIAQIAGALNLASGAVVDASLASGGFAMSGGGLSGTGQVTGNLDQTGGTLAPGTTGMPGTFTVSGNYTEGSGATVAIPINGTASSDYSVLAVSGNANLVGNLSLQPSLSYSSAAATGDSDPVFTFGGTLTGNFASASVAPQNTALPQVSSSSGTAVGDLLTCEPGTFTDSPTTLAYHWDRNGAVISDATSNTYTVQSADLGSALSCAETASGGVALSGGNGFGAVVGSGVIDAVVGSSYASGSTSATSAGTAIALPASSTPAVVIPAGSLQDGSDHEAYGGASIAACGGTAPSCEVYSPPAGTLVDSSGTAVATPEQFTFARTSGTLPAGMQLSTEGYLYGTPSQAGTFQFSVVATDPSSNSSNPYNYTLTISPAAAVTLSPATLSDGRVHDSYATALTACGGTASSCQVYSPSAGTLVDTSDNPVPAPDQFSFATTSGSLPQGITLSSQGYLSGTPTQSGSYQFTVVATDATDDASSPYSYTLVVAPAPTVASSPATLTGAIGANAYGAAITACGGTASICESYSPAAGTLVDGSGNTVASAQRFTFVVSSGSLPPGITLSSQGYLSGTPTETGSYQFAVSATDDAQDPSSPYTYTLTVDPGISISAGSVHIAGALPAGATTITPGSAGGINAISIGGSSGSLTTLSGSGVPADADQVSLQIGHDQSGDCDTELEIGNAQGVVFNASNLDISGCDSAAAESSSASIMGHAITRATDRVRAGVASASATTASSIGLSGSGSFTLALGEPTIGATSNCSTAFNGTTETFVNTSGTGTCTATTEANGEQEIEISGGTFTGELTGAAQSTSDQLTALVDSASSIPPLMQVTPLTTYVDSLASGLSSGGTAVSTAHTTASQALMSAYGFGSGTSAETVVPNFASDTDDQSLELSLLQALGSEATSESTSAPDLAALVNALASEADDGEFSNPVLEQLGSGTLPSTAGTSLFQTAPTAFESQYSSSIPSLAPAGTTIKETLPVISIPVTLPIIAVPIPVGQLTPIGPGAFTETVTASSPSTSSAPFPASGGASFTIEVVS
jgi:hypothetical protein